MSDLNPCMTCGACCAYFRVSFYWAEASDGGGTVPVQLTEPSLFSALHERYEQKQSRCSALEGTPGEATL
jgi:Fe-S-cluster containining protein